MAHLDALEMQVARVTSVTGSAVTLIRGLADQLRHAANDPAKVAALAAELEAGANDLAAAVAENTPAAPPPVEPPVEPPAEPPAEPVA